MAENRGLDVSKLNDTQDDFRVGIKDIDTAIFYYFNEVIKPNVVQNGKQINVPVVYGSPERWKSMQKDGYFRDKNGKMQAPLIVFRRETVEKNYSKKNVYDRFSAVNNRVGTTEYHAVAIPDYVNITYSCVIFTDYVEQNNKLIESINFASDSYWGDPSSFHFRAMIDTFTTSQEIVQGNDRIVKSNFTINLLGHIVTDAINALAVNSKKYFSKAAVKVTSETVKNINDL